MLTSAIRDAVQSGAFDNTFVSLYNDTARPRARYTKLLDEFLSLYGDRDCILFSVPGSSAQYLPMGTDSPVRFSCRNTACFGMACVVIPGIGSSDNKGRSSFNRMVLPLPRVPVRSRWRL